MKILWSLGWALGICISTVGCGQKIQIGFQQAQAAASDLDPTPAEPPSGAAAFQICSVLQFENTNWDSSLTLTDREAFKLSLNISGSFEEAHSWSNITNNFDGQGLSLGLLNQTLGTGSLQPLLIKMRDQHPNTLQRIYSPAHLESLLNMLSEWQGNQTLQEIEGLEFSPLDIPDTKSALVVMALSRNQKSRNWAVDNLYNGSRFKPEWLAELKAMAESPEYVTIQIEAATGLFKRALNMQSRLQIFELRSYLLMFDFATQNGSVRSEHFAEYETWLATNPQSTNTERMEKLLEIRLRDVNPTYVEDVKSRKRTIILGTGTVHGDRRNLPQEYCYNSVAAYRLGPANFFQIALAKY